MNRGSPLLALALLAGCPYDFVLGDPVDSGPEDGGAVTVRAPGVAGAACVSYLDCAAQDCASGVCVERSTWTCTLGGDCVWDGGSCRANVASCSSFGDCCSQACVLGICFEGNPATVELPDAGDNSSCIAHGRCTDFQDCCSQTCFRGLCARTPSTELCHFGSPCVAYSDCCSFECRAGVCVDSTSP